MEIHSTTVYDKKTVEIFTRENLKKLLSLNIVVLIIATIIFLESIYEVASLGNPLEVMFGPLFLFGFSIFLFLYIMIILPKINYRNHKTATDAVNEYTFYDTKMCVTSSAKGIVGSGETEYSALHKVIETKGYIYMYIAKGRAYIIDKSTITGGRVEEIRSAVISQIGFKKYKMKL